MNSTPTKWVGSKFTIKDEELKLIVQRLVHTTKEKIEHAESYIDKHNAFTAYSIMLLFSATGHRPVEDPFCSKLDYDLNLGMILLDDKAPSEKHRYRIVALPQIAIDQFGEYEKHLRWLISHLKNETISPNPKNAIQQLLDTSIPKENQILPLFFFLKRKKHSLETISLSESVLKKYFSDLWPLPYNFSRHNIATQLRKIWITQHAENLTIENIKAHMGHMEGVHHPFGTASVISPLCYRDQIKEPLSNLLEKQCWSVMTAKRDFKKITENQEQPAWEHTNKLLGPFKRKLKRDLRIKQDEEVVCNALNYYSEEQLLTKASLLKKVRNTIISESKNNKDRIKTRLVILWKKLLELKKRHPSFKLPRRLHLIDAEPSPFKEESLLRYNQAQNLRHNFINYLRLEGVKDAKNTKRKLQYYRRLAEILVSAALYDGICNKDILNILSQSNISLIHEGRIIYLDLLESNANNKRLIYRWLPQPLSIALTIGLDNKEIVNNRPQEINEDRLHDELIKLLKLLGVEILKEKAVINILAAISHSYWIMHTPPFLREIANGNLPVQPLPESALVRLIRNEKLIHIPSEAQDSLTESKPVLNYAATVKESSHNIKNVKQFKHDLAKAINDASKRQDTTRKKAGTKKKQALEQSLRSQLTSDHKHPSIAVALASWCIKLCTTGTDLYGKIAFSTVVSYTNMITNALIYTFYNQNFFNLDAEDYDYIYDVALEINGHSDQTKFLNNLCDFHNFLVESKLAPPLDWSNYKRKVYENRLLSSVGANLITPAEYRNSLYLLYRLGKDGQCSKRTSSQYCALLIFGYRFGLRISEALHLLYRDIQHNDDWSFMVTNVRNTYFADTKSKSGIRQIPLVGTLSKYESHVLKTVCTRTNVAESDELAAIFSLTNDKQKLINSVQASQVLQSVLKHVTGDKSTHYHLLRHSYNSRTYPCFFDIKPSKFSYYIKKLSGKNYIAEDKLRSLLSGRDYASSNDLKSLSVIAGHARASTTFSHYIHTADHHIHYITAQDIHWSIPSIKRVDYIASYATGKSWQTLSRQFKRKKINPDNLHDALSIASSSKKLKRSHVKTTPYSPNDVFFMNNILITNEISLVDIDNILLLLCSKEDMKADLIAERLFLNTEDVTNILFAFQKQKSKSAYMGYEINNTSRENNDVDIESAAETLSLQTVLISTTKKLTNLSEKDYKTIHNGINAWSNAYHPKTRYRPLIFDEAEHAINYIDTMKLLDTPSYNMQVNVPQKTPTWCQPSIKKNSKGKSIGLTLKSTQINKTYLLNNVTISKEIPLPTSKSRYKTKDRLSISLVKSKKNKLYVQKRLHRFCFLISIWFHLPLNK